jgi:predicted Zn-dependent peptidase
VLCEEIRKVRDRGVTEQELIRAKNQALAYLATQAEGAESRMETNADHLMSYGRLKSKEELSAEINAVTVEAVNAVANRVFSGKPTLATAGSYRRAASYDNVLSLLNPN